MRWFHVIFCKIRKKSQIAERVIMLMIPYIIIWNFLYIHRTIWIDGNLTKYFTFFSKKSNIKLNTFLGNLVHSCHRKKSSTSSVQALLLTINDSRPFNVQLGKSFLFNSTICKMIWKGINTFVLGSLYWISFNGDTILSFSSTLGRRRSAQGI